MSIARTKKVVINGNISVSQGQCVIIATVKATAEIKNSSQ
jgi:hypothetical protein